MESFLDARDRSVNIIRTYDYIMATTNKQIVGYTCGVYDLFHIGHLNLLRTAKAMCDKLIVGVSVDGLVSYKNKTCIIPFDERIEIVRAIKYVDCAIPQISRDKVEAYHKLKYDILFVGDDWYQCADWVKWETELKGLGVSVIYIPYTNHISTTKIVGDIINKYISK